ncbi:MAG TPA: hypothetical protein VGI75_08805 [Pirellulales bacterium]
MHLLAPAARIFAGRYSSDNARGYAVNLPEDVDFPPRGLSIPGNLVVADQHFPTPLERLLERSTELSDEHHTTTPIVLITIKCKRRANRQSGLTGTFGTHASRPNRASPTGTVAHVLSFDTYPTAANCSCQQA